MIFIQFNKNKGKAMYYHRKSVLEEVFRQKTEDDWLNWDKLAKVSASSSAPQQEQARKLAKEDETERIRVWSTNTVEQSQTNTVKSPSAPKDTKSKHKSSHRFFGLFKKK